MEPLLDLDKTQIESSNFSFKDRRHRIILLKILEILEREFHKGSAARLLTESKLPAPSIAILAKL